MKKVSYTLHFGNGKPESYTKTIFEFLSEQTLFFMFVAGALPPLNVLNDLFSHSYKGNNAEYCDGLDWQAFAITKEEYQELSPLLIERFSLKSVDVPASINTLYDWDLWGYTHRFDVPFEKYKKLSDDVLEKKNKLQKALEKGNQDEITHWHLQHFYSGTEAAEFLEDYLPSNE